MNLWYDTQTVKVNLNIIYIVSEYAHDYKEKNKTYHAVYCSHEVHLLGGHQSHDSNCYNASQFSQPSI